MNVLQRLPPPRSLQIKRRPPVPPPTGGRLSQAQGARQTILPRIRDGDKEELASMRPPPPRPNGRSDGATSSQAPQEKALAGTSSHQRAHFSKQFASMRLPPPRPIGRSDGAISSQAPQEKALAGTSSHQRAHFSKQLASMRLPPPRPIGRSDRATSSQALRKKNARRHLLPPPSVFFRLRQSPSLPAPDPDPTRHPGEDEQSRVAFGAPRSKTNGAPAQSRKRGTRGQEAVKTFTDERTKRSLTTQ